MILDITLRVDKNALYFIYMAGGFAVFIWNAMSQESFLLECLIDPEIPQLTTTVAYITLWPLFLIKEILH